MRPDGFGHRAGVRGGRLQDDRPRSGRGLSRQGARPHQEVPRRWRRERESDRGGARHDARQPVGRDERQRAEGLRSRSSRRSSRTSTRSARPTRRSSRWSATTTIFLSNTSSLCITELAAATARPDRFGGLHFFNPVPIMKLVEVIRALTTSDETYQTVFAFAQSLGKEPITAPDRPGFIVNRLLVPYLLDAIRAYENGLGTLEDIDKGMKLGCGYPMGPFTLLDFVGLDTTYYIANIMFEEFREPAYAPPPLLKRMVLAGRLGRKSGQGFYRYDRIEFSRDLGVEFYFVLSAQQPPRLVLELAILGCPVRIERRVDDALQLGARFRRCGPRRAATPRGRNATRCWWGCRSATCEDALRRASGCRRTGRGTLKYQRPSARSAEPCMERGIEPQHGLELLLDRLAVFDALRAGRTTRPARPCWRPIQKCPSGRSGCSATALRPASMPCFEQRALLALRRVPAQPVVGARQLPGGFEVARVGGERGRATDSAARRALARLARSAYSASGDLREPRCAENRDIE